MTKKLTHDRLTFTFSDQVIQRINDGFAEARSHQDSTLTLSRYVQALLDVALPPLRSGRRATAAAGDEPVMTKMTATITTAELTQEEAAYQEVRALFVNDRKAQRLQVDKETMQNYLKANRVYQETLNNYEKLGLINPEEFQKRFFKDHPEFIKK